MRKYWIHYEGKSNEDLTPHGIDTNVLFAALKSSRGASYKLVSLIPSKRFSIAISVPLIIEYEDVLRRGKLPDSITEKDITDFIDYLCYVGEHQEIFFLLKFGVDLSIKSWKFFSYSMFS